MQFHPHLIRRGNGDRKFQAEIDNLRSLIAPNHALPADRPGSLLDNELFRETNVTYSFSIIPVGFHGYIYMNEIQIINREVNLSTHTPPGA